MSGDSKLRRDAESNGSHRRTADRTCRLRSGADAADAGGREGERSASASIFVTDEPPADVALIVCERDAVKLKDQVVRAERDGVHLLVENPGGA